MARKGPVVVAGGLDVGAGRGRELAGASDVAEQLVGVPGAARRWLVEARLPAVQGRSGHAGGRSSPGRSRAQHRVDGACLQRAKGEAGLADYEVRSWRAVSPPSVLAGGDVVPDGGSGPGKKVDAGALTVPQLQGLIAGALERRLGTWRSGYIRRTARALRWVEQSAFLPLDGMQPIASLRIDQRE